MKTWHTGAAILAALLMVPVGFAIAQSDPADSGDATGEVPAIPAGPAESADREKLAEAAGTQNGPESNQISGTEPSQSQVEDCDVPNPDLLCQVIQAKAAGELEPGTYTTPELKEELEQAGVR